MNCYQEKLDLAYTATKSHFCVPFLEIARSQSQFHIHVSVSDLNVPRIGPHISCSRIGRLIMGIYKSLEDIRLWKFGLWPRNSFSGSTSTLYCTGICICLSGVLDSMHPYTFVINIQSTSLTLRGPPEIIQHFRIAMYSET